MLMRPDLRTQQRDFLLEITRAITAQLDLSEVLRRVLHASLVMLAGRVGIVALSNKSDGRFYVRAFSGIAADTVPELNLKLQELMDPGDAEGFSREFLNTKLREMADAIDSRLSQSIAMPLVFAQNPLGLLIVFRSYHTTITPEDLNTLQSFADQAAIAVNNAQLYGDIQHEHQRLEAIINSSGDGVLILDPDLTIQQANDSFARMSGWLKEDMIDLPKSEIIVWEKREGPDLEDAMEIGWAGQAGARPAGRTLYVEGDMLRRDGMALGIGITYAPLLNSDGDLECIIANARDITHIREAQEMQSVFISTVHHELRTPIAIIKGYASTLGRDDVEWERDVIREKMAIIEDESDRLTNLVEDLLTASKIQSAQVLQLNKADVNLSDLAARSVARLESQTAQRIELSFPEEFPSVLGDETRLRQVIDNLLTNAIKYSPDDKTITVGGRYNPQSVTVFVRDDGVGIAKEELARVFDRFYRSDNSITRRTQGTGLGLYLVKAIVEAHGGEIAAKSQVGSGSTFYFTIPRD